MTTPQAPEPHPRWTAEGAPMDLPPAFAAIFAAEAIVRAALDAAEVAEKEPPDRPE